MDRNIWKSLVVAILLIAPLTCTGVEVDVDIGGMILRNLKGADGKLKGRNFCVEHSSLARSNGSEIYVIQIRDQLTGRIGAVRYLNQEEAYLNGKFYITKTGELSEEESGSFLGAMSFSAGRLISEELVSPDGKDRRILKYGGEDKPSSIEFIDKEGALLKELIIDVDGFIAKESVLVGGEYVTELRPSPVKITTIKSGIEWSSVSGTLEESYINRAPFQASFSLTFKESDWTIERLEMTFAGVASRLVIKSDCVESSRENLRLYYGMTLNSFVKLVKNKVDEQRKMEQ